VYQAPRERRLSCIADHGSRGQTMNTESHLYIAEARARELHRAAALSRLPKPERRRRNRVLTGLRYGSSRTLPSLPPAAKRS
jgi:hypothetical protein